MFRFLAVVACLLGSFLCGMVSVAYAVGPDGSTFLSVLNGVGCVVWVWHAAACATAERETNRPV